MNARYPRRRDEGLRQAKVEMVSAHECEREFITQADSWLLQKGTLEILSTWEKFYQEDVARSLQGFLVWVYGNN